MASQATDDNTALRPFAPVAVTDPDFGATDAVAITLTNAQGAASDANGLLSGTGLTKTGVGTYSVAMATPGVLSAALDLLVFTPTAKQVAAGQTVTTGFKLTATDGLGGSATSTATSVVATALNRVTGPANGGATLTGTAGTDIITAQGYSNTIRSGGSNDVIVAGLGQATVDVAGGNVALILSGYNNVVTGANGNDMVTGAQGNTTVTLGNGNDTVTLGGYSDAVTLGSGNNIVTGPQGNATVTLGGGSNVVTLGGYNNVVHAGSGTGTSYINAGARNEVVTGGDGSFVVVAGGYGDQVQLGNGNNWVFMSPAGANPSLPAGTLVPVEQGNAVVTTGAGNDTIWLGGYGD